MRNYHINRDTETEFFRTVNYICLLAISQNDIKPIEIIKKCLVNEHRLFSLFPIVKLFIHFYPKFQETTQKLLFDLIPAAIDNEESIFERFVYINRLALKKKVITNSDFFDIVSCLLFRNYLNRHTFERIISFIKKEFLNQELLLNYVLLKSAAELYGLQKLNPKYEDTIVGNKLTENSYDFKTNSYRWELFKADRCTLEQGLFEKYIVPFIRNNAKNLLEYLIYNIIYAKPYWDWYTDTDLRDFGIKTKDLKKLPNLVNVFFVYCIQLLCDIPLIKKELKENYSELFIALLEKDYKMVENFGKELTKKMKIDNRLLKRTISENIQEVSIFTQMELIKLLFEFNPEYIQKNIKKFLASKIKKIKEFTYEFVKEKKI